MPSRLEEKKVGERGAASGAGKCLQSCWPCPIPPSTPLLQCGLPPPSGDLSPTFLAGLGVGLPQLLDLRSPLSLLPSFSSVHQSFHSWKPRGNPPGNPPLQTPCRPSPDKAGLLLLGSPSPFPTLAQLLTQSFLQSLLNTCCGLGSTWALVPDCGQRATLSVAPCYPHSVAGRPPDDPSGVGSGKSSVFLLGDWPGLGVRKGIPSRSQDL